MSFIFNISAHNFFTAFPNTKMLELLGMIYFAYEDYCVRALLQG